MSESDTSLAHLDMLHSETSTLRTFIGGRLPFVTQILKCNRKGIFVAEANVQKNFNLMVN